MQLSAMSQPPADAILATILLAEDEGALRALIKRVLVAAGYRVYDASNGSEAASVWQRHAHEIDLVLTDVIMPHLGGHGLVAEITAQRPDVKVLFMSGYPGNVELPQTIELTAMNFLEKPFSPTALIERIRQVLDC